MIPKVYPQTLPKAILFDWDNTLVNTWRVSFEALNLALTSVGKSTMTEEQFWKKPHKSLRDVAQDLFGEHYVEGERVFYEAVEQLHLKDLSALEGAETALQQLSDRNIYLGVVSNKHGDFLRKEVHHLGWGKHFQSVIGARDLAEDKPSPLPVKAALEKGKIAPGHDVWFVGDSIIDVLCAHASGCVPVVVGHGEASEQKNIIHARNCDGLAKLISTL